MNGLFEPGSSDDGCHKIAALLHGPSDTEPQVKDEIGYTVRLELCQGIRKISLRRKVKTLRGGDSRRLAYAFTDSSVLRLQTVVEVNNRIMRGFVSMRRFIDSIPNREIRNDFPKIFPIFAGYSTKISLNIYGYNLKLCCSVYYKSLAKRGPLSRQYLSRKW